VIEERRKTLELSLPCRFGDKEISSLTLVPPKVSWRLRAERLLRGGVHNEAMSQYQAELIGKCAGVAPGVIEELYEPDFIEANTWVTSFERETPAYAEPEESTRTIELPEEITVDGRAYSSLILGKTKLGWRRQAEGHLRNGQHPEALTNYSVALLAKSAGVDQKVILALDDDVFFNGWWFVTSFLPGGPATTTA
jgi:hypothetical protein